MAKRACDQCEFWDELVANGGSHGLCRFSAPMGDIEIEDADLGYGNHRTVLWPKTERDDWCGDFVKRGSEGDDAPLSQDNAKGCQGE